MSTSKRPYSLIGAFVLAGALSACAIFPKSSNPTADKAITTDLQTRFAQDGEYISPNEFDIQTVNGIVYLNGRVRTGLQKRRAEDIASNNENVVKVVNNLSVTHD
jgi:osmotically-inducible protein OsmY